MAEQEKIVDNVTQETVVENDGFDSGDPIATFVLKELSIQNERLEKASLRQEIANKRQQRVIYFLIGTIIALVAGFFLFLYQYDFATYDIISETGNANYIGNDGDIMNGADSGEGAY